MSGGHVVVGVGQNTVRPVENPAAAAVHLHIHRLVVLLGDQNIVDRRVAAPVQSVDGLPQVPGIHHSPQQELQRNPLQVHGGVGGKGVDPVADAAGIEARPGDNPRLAAVGDGGSSVFLLNDVVDQAFLRPDEIVPVLAHIGGPVHRALAGDRDGRAGLHLPQRLLVAVFLTSGQLVPAQLLQLCPAVQDHQLLKFHARSVGDALYLLDVVRVVPLHRLHKTHGDADQFLLCHIPPFQAGFQIVLVALSHPVRVGFPVVVSDLIGRAS